MPPKSHSSSSHSSSSHSSRSSFSSSRSYSSSSSRSYGSSSYSRPSRGPSSHSSTSHSSRPSYSSSAQRPTTIPNKPRRNQPTGFRPVQGVRPAYHYARRHDYIFYPVAWIDQSTGNSYQAGYYDEDGKRYDSVAFKKGDSYDNVVCHCPYCEQDTILNLTSEQIASQSLTCPNCGGQMTIQSALDEYAGSAGNAAGTSSSDDYSEVKAVKKKNSTLKWVIIGLAALLSLRIWSGQKADKPQADPGNSGITIVQNNQAVTNTDLFGSVLYFTQHEDGSYGLLSNTAQEYDKMLIWDAESESYYDSSTECWIWYNTNVTPAVWQYWYEGISSEYDEGWMEYDAGEQRWYIEATHGNWIKLPAKYDASKLWHISG